MKLSNETHQKVPLRGLRGMSAPSILEKHVCSHRGEGGTEVHPIPGGRRPPGLDSIVRRGLGDASRRRQTEGSVDVGPYALIST